MRKNCTFCGTNDIAQDIEVTVRMRGLTYSTYVQGRFCGTCVGRKIDPNEFAAYTVGIAKRLVDTGPMTGRGLAFCRKAIRLTPEDLAKRLNISAECLLALEDSGIPVPREIYIKVRRNVRDVFDMMAFTPRIDLDAGRH